MVHIYIFNIQTRRNSKLIFGASTYWDFFFINFFIYVLLGLTFHGLGNVKSLKLRKNNIKFLMDGAFFGLNSMEQLYLDRNQVLTWDTCRLIPRTAIYFLGPVTITGVYTVQFIHEYIVHSIV